MSKNEETLDRPLILTNGGSINSEWETSTYKGHVLQCSTTEHLKRLHMKYSAKCLSILFPRNRTLFDVTVPVRDHFNLSLFIANVAIPGLSTTWIMSMS